MAGAVEGDNFCGSKANELRGLVSEIAVDAAVVLTTGVRVQLALRHPMENGIIHNW